MSNRERRYSVASMRHDTRIRHGVRAAAVALITAGTTIVLSGCVGPADSAGTSSPTPIPTMAQPMPSGDGTLVIGVVVPFTGIDAAVGAASLAGVELAARDIDEASGVNGATVTVLHADAVSGDKAVAALDGRGVDALIGPNVAGLIPVVDAAEDAAGIPGLSASGDALAADDAFLSRLRSADPTLTESRYGAESYDAAVILALAASLAGDDGRVSLAQFLPAITSGDIECSSFGACLDALKSRTAIRYTGVTGQLGVSDSVPAPGALALIGLVP